MAESPQAEVAQVPLAVTPSTSDVQMEDFAKKGDGSRVTFALGENSGIDVASAGGSEDIGMDTSI
eukprot:TRINITY_DN9832_c1_g1_i1.p4 TRINITY_DN9832_c1_g1~~TRINITY_DN9832_c1_g1_i1.p4  ORF type:complete len:65 (-),score=18.26 TRINITY_DN9832_c1_g1_i1:180-374(-)